MYLHAKVIVSVNVSNTNTNECWNGSCKPRETTEKRFPLIMAKAANPIGKLKYPSKYVFKTSNWNLSSNICNKNDKCVLKKNNYMFQNWEHN